VLSRHSRLRLSFVLARIASDAAQNSYVSDRAAFKLCTRLYYWFQLFALPRDSDAAKVIARTMVWAGIVRPLVCKRGVSPDVTAFVVDVVRKLEGAEAATEVDRVAVRWQQLVKQQQRYLRTLDGETSAAASAFRIVPYHTLNSLAGGILAEEEPELVDLRQNPFLKFESVELIKTRYYRYKELAGWLEDDKAKFTLE
jgi:hypothetical protein